jgi:hypothetical protein
MVVLIHVVERHLHVVTLPNHDTSLHLQVTDSHHRPPRTATPSHVVNHLGIAPLPVLLPTANLNLAPANTTLTTVNVTSRLDLAMADQMTAVMPDRGPRSLVDRS